VNIARHVERVARLFPERPAILFEGETISYGELDARAGRLANALAGQGVRPGDRVALFLPNIPAFAVCYLGALKAGAIAVSVDAALKSEEVGYILNDSGAVVVFTAAAGLRYVPREACPALRHVVVCEGDRGGHPSLDDWLSRAAPDGRAADVDRDAPAAVLYTSGTTGFPKGATLTHGNVVSNTCAAAHHAGMRQDDRLTLFLPLTHVFGQNFIMNGAFQAGATVVLHRRFAPDEVLESIARHRVTMFPAVPTVYMRLVDQDLDEDALASIRYWFSAGALMPEATCRRWTERFGRPVYEGYGLTEASPFASYNHDLRHKPGSVGTPVDNVEAKVLDGDDREVPPGETGEICIKGPGVMRGYWRRPEDTARALRSGWLHSGDVGTVDDEGYLHIVDRLKDMVNRGGLKVWPAEVERVLHGHPAVKEAAVYGVPHPTLGETVKAAVVLKDGATTTQDEVIGFCQDRLAAYKTPAGVAFVEDLPKSPAGKVLKRVLREGHGSPPPVPVGA
jgi:long-chain acyl-CoA synthetase